MLHKREVALRKWIWQLIKPTLVYFCLLSAEFYCSWIMANKGISNKDSFQKINFLNQASQMIAKKNSTLSCYYSVLMKEVAKKSVLKMWVTIIINILLALIDVYFSDPSVKRNFCKRCSVGLIVDRTCDIQEENNNLVISCQKCGYIRKFPMKSDYKLWVEKPEAIMEAMPPKIPKEQVIGKRSKNKNLGNISWILLIKLKCYVWSRVLIKKYLYLCILSLNYRNRTIKQITCFWNNMALLIN